MTRYQIFYQENIGKEVKIAVINALTAPSALNKFEQMYHDCYVKDIKEILDEN
jgi:hypothetical protein